MDRNRTYKEFRDFFEKYYIDLYKNDILEYYKSGIFCDISSRVKEVDGANYDDWINSLKELFESNLSSEYQVIPNGLYNYDDENEINKLYDTILKKVEKGIKTVFYIPSLKRFSNDQKEELKKIFNIGKEKERWACANVFSEFEKEVFDETFNNGRILFSNIEAKSAVEGTDKKLNDSRFSLGVDDLESYNPKRELEDIKTIIMTISQYNVWWVNDSHKYMDELYSISKDNFNLDNYQFDINAISDYSEQLELVKSDIDMMLYILEFYGDLDQLIKEENGVINYLNKYLPEKGKVDAITVDGLKEYIKSLDISQSNDVEDMLRISRIISNKLAHGYLKNYLKNYISTGVNIEIKHNVNSEIDKIVESVCYDLITLVKPENDEPVDYFFDELKKYFIDTFRSDIMYELVDDNGEIETILNKENDALTETINVFSNCYSKLREAENLEETLQESLEETLQKCTEVILNPSKEQLEKCSFLENLVNDKEREMLESPNSNTFDKTKTVNAIFERLKDKEKEKLKEFCDVESLRKNANIIKDSEELKRKYKKEIIIPFKKSILISKLICEILENAGLQNNEISWKTILEEDSLEGYKINNGEAIKYLQKNKEIFLSQILDSDKGLISDIIDNCIKQNKINNLNGAKIGSRNKWKKGIREFVEGVDRIAIINSANIEEYYLKITERIIEYLDEYRDLIINEFNDKEMESCFKEFFEKIVEDDDEQIKDSKENLLNDTDVKKKRIIKEFKELYQEVEDSGIFKNTKRLFQGAILQYSLTDSIYRIKNQITQVMLGFAANNDKKYFIEGKAPSKAELGIFNIYMDNIPQTNSCHCKWWEVKIDDTIKVQPREKGVEDLYQGNSDGLSLNTYMPWPRLTEEQIEGFKELLNVIEKVEKDEQIEEQTAYQATTYDELKKLKTDNPNSFKALKIRTMLGSGINYYREYCKSNTVEKAGNEEFVTTFFHDQKSGAYSVRAMLDNERFMEELSYVGIIRESMRFINVLPKDKSSDEKQDDKSL